MEYILAGIWKGQMSNSKLLRSIPGNVNKYYQLPMFHSVKGSHVLQVRKIARSSKCSEIRNDFQTNLTVLK